MAEVTSINKEKLISNADRIGRLEEEGKGLKSDIKDIYAALKADGFNVKIVKKAIALKTMDPEKRKMEELELDLYLQAFGIN